MLTTTQQQLPTKSLFQIYNDLTFFFNLHSYFELEGIPLIKTINLILHFSKIHNAENIKLEVYTYLPKF